MEQKQFFCFQTRPGCKLQEWQSRKPDLLHSSAVRRLRIELVWCWWKVSRYAGAQPHPTSPSASVCVNKWCSNLGGGCVCSLSRETGLLSKLDSVIGSSENPNEAMSTSAAALLPGAPGSPQAGPSPACTDQMESEARGDRGKKKGWWTSSCFSCCEGDCGKAAVNMMWWAGNSTGCLGGHKCHVLN